MERKLLNRLIVPYSSRIRMNVGYSILLLNTDLESDREKY
jgi:hypothetical protein